MWGYEASFSVSRLVRALVGDFYFRNEKRRRGKECKANFHKKLGFEVEGLYEKYFRHDGKIYRIYGSPDRLNRKEKVVEELKTFRYVENLELQRTRGIYQLKIYCYLVGYRTARLYLYDVCEGRYTEILTFGVSPKEQRKTIEKAIERIMQEKNLQ